MRFKSRQQRPAGCPGVFFTTKFIFECPLPDFTLHGVVFNIPYVHAYTRQRTLALPVPPSSIVLTP